jgi:hypothetical protein
MQDGKRTEILQVLDAIDQNVLTDLIWEVSWTAVHGLNTTDMKGLKFGTMKGADAYYCIGVFKTLRKQIVRNGESPLKELVVFLMQYRGITSCGNGSEKI